MKNLFCVEFENKIRKFADRHNMLSSGHRVLAGFSGGADSLCLLRVLSSFPEIELYAIHVEHGIRGDESLADADFAEKFCQKLGVPLKTVHVDVPAYVAKNHVTEEEGARILRYDAFFQYASEISADKIAVAHHADDLAETVLFNLTRGSGMAGIYGIPPVRDNIIRPLLNVRRSEIEEYLETFEDVFCTDATNTDINYSRNRIRKQIIPELETINNKAVDHIAAMASEAFEVNGYIKRIADSLEEAVLQYRDGAAYINAKALSEADPVPASFLIRKVLFKIAGSAKDIHRQHVDSVIALAELSVGKQVSLPYDMTAKRSYEEIVVAKSDVKAGKVEQIPLFVMDIPINPLDFSIKVEDKFTICGKVDRFSGDMGEIPSDMYTKWFDYDKINGHLQLRNRQTGDIYKPGENTGFRKLKKYFIDEKIPEEIRDEIILLADGEHVLWILGYRISEEYKVSAETENVLKVNVVFSDQ